MLPNLPKIRKHKEQDITPLVFAWFEDRWINSVALEIKIKGGKLYPHQVVALKQVQKGSFSHKIKDTGSRNPFDGFILKKADAFIVVCDKRICIAYNPDMKKQFDFRV